MGINCLFIGCKKDKMGVPPRGNTPPEVFSKTFGGDRDDHFDAIVKTADGGYLLAGSESSGNGSGDIPVNPPVGGNFDLFIVKVGPDGSRQWVTTIGGNNNEFARSIAISPDGSGYVIVGYAASSSSGDIPVTRGAFDMLVVKLDLNGKKQWVKTFGGYGSDEAHSITLSPGGDSYIIAGSTTTDNDGDIPKIHQKLFSFFSEIIVLSLKLDGTLQWIKNYGGSFGEDVRSIIASPDGSGYVLTGYTSSDSSGDIPDTQNGTSGLSDMLVLKLGLDGNKQWIKTFGGNSFDYATCVAGRPDRSGYIIAGMVESTNTGEIPASKGESDVVVIGLDNEGNKQWLKTYGGDQIDDVFGIAAFPNGDCLLTGNTSTNNNGDIPKNQSAGISSMDLLTIRVGPDGSKRWIKSYGGNLNDQGAAVVINTDGSFVLCGVTASNNSFDVPANHGREGSIDGWVIKETDH